MCSTCTAFASGLKVRQGKAAERSAVRDRKSMGRSTSDVGTLRQYALISRTPSAKSTHVQGDAVAAAVLRDGESDVGDLEELFDGRGVRLVSHPDARRERIHLAQRQLEDERLAHPFHRRRGIE